MAANDAQMFWDTVGRVVSQNIAATPIDLTVNAEVVKLRNPTNGEYLVKYQGDTFSAFTTDPTVTYAEGEQVFVLVPSGNFSNKKMIIGRSSAQENFSYAEMQELTNFYIPQSPNLLADNLYGMDHESLGICAVPRNERQRLQHSMGANYTDYGFARWPSTHVYKENIADQKIRDKWEELFGPEIGNITDKENSVHAADLYPASFKNFKKIQSVDKLAYLWGRSWEYLGVKAKFRTNFLAEHNKGKYGIRVEYLVRNNAYHSKTLSDGTEVITGKDHRKYLVKTLEMTFDSFVGNPYAMPIDTQQTCYFKIPKGSFVGLNRVCLFQNDEEINVSEDQIRVSDMESDYMPTYNTSGEVIHNKWDNIYDRNNIFCSEIDIRWYEKKNLLNQMFYVHVTSEQGNCVYNDSNSFPGVPYVDLVAHLYYGGKDILNADDYEVHWYRECPDYKAASWPGDKKDIHNNYIASYSDDGWAPVFRPKDFSEADAEYGMFVEEFGPQRVDEFSRPVQGEEGHEAANYQQIDYRTMRVPRDRVPWQWYYTCVIVQKPKVEVTDNNGKVISTSKDVATSYKYKPMDDELGVQGYLVMRTDSKYDLDLSEPATRPDGRIAREYMHIIDYNNMDYRRNPPWPLVPWYGNWWYKHPGKKLAAYDGNVKNLLGGENGMEGNVEVTRYLGTAYVQFVVGAIDPGVVVKYQGDEEDKEAWLTNFSGKMRELTIGVLHKVLTKDDAQDVIVEWEGDQHFIYNYDGSVKSWFSQDGFCIAPLVSWPKGNRDFVSYSLYGPEGVNSVAELETLDYYDKLLNDDATAGEVYNLTAGQGHNPQCDSMLQNIYIEPLESGLFRAHFSVRQEYNTTYANGRNSFWLVIHCSDGTDLGPFECPITFSKDGSGANGTGWSVDIDTCVPYKSQLETGVLEYSRSRFLNPLVVYCESPYGSEVNHWQNVTVDNTPNGSPVFPVVLRPFVYKGGYGTGARGDGYDIEKENSQITDFFDFAPELGYWAETFWSATFDQGVSDKTMQYDSYIKFYKPNGGLYTNADWKAESGTPLPKGLDWEGREGGVAYTHSADGNHGAIEVRFNPKLISPDSAKYGYEFYQFIVSAMTIIHRGCEVEDGDGGYAIQPHSQNSELVTTIWSYYPVDIILIRDKNKVAEFVDKFDPRKIDCNWPREVLYSGTGISPAFDDPADGLYFFYGSLERPKADGTGVVVDYPRSMVSHNFQWYPAFNLTTQVQNLEYVRSGKVTLDATHQKLTQYPRPEIKVYDQGSVTDGASYHYEWVAQKYSPTPALQGKTMLFGLLSTDFMNRWVSLPKGEDEESPDVYQELRNDPFHGEAIFFRNQVFQLSRYSNNGVNAWNGRDIMIDNDLGTICAPTVAAGYKNPMTNDFTGVIMGVDKNQKKDGVYKAGLTETASGVGNKGFAISEDGFDNRWYGMSSVFEKYNEANPYMAGVYGYQMGVPTFGLMENGTAFFGRADGGCQIILDGSNGVIYGGGNGYISSPSIKDPMWNTMRITLVDNTRDGYKEKIIPPNALRPEGSEPARGYTGMNVYKGQNSDGNSPECPPTDNPIRLDFEEFIDGVSAKGEHNRLKLPNWYKTIWERAYICVGDLPYFLQKDYICVEDLPRYSEKLMGGGDEGYFNNDRGVHGNYRINYWDNTILCVHENNDADTADTTSGALELGKYSMSTFGYGKASTTPAIEIGQHPHGLMPGILGWCQWKEVFEDFYIPGDRNFMVTYDGSLWAMNAIIMGNIIGSNIIGGRIQGAEIGIGCLDIKEPYEYQLIEDNCDWPPLQAPTYSWETDPTRNGVVIEKCAGEGVPGVYIDQWGNMAASSLRIFGGSIDIGTFHIIGKKPQTGAASEAAKDHRAYGELIQYGQSDFVGLVHCYGNLGVGPNLGAQGGNSGGSNFGNFTQIKGQVAMGIAFKEGDTSVHEWIAENLGMKASNYGVTRNKIAKYMASPGNEVGTTGTLQQAAFFGLDSSPDVPERGDPSKTYRGHWWPMAFYYNSEPNLEELTSEQVPGWFTTMNLFKSEGSAAPVAQAGQDTNIEKGANYFRVSPFGTESRFIFIRHEWQDEDKADKPSFETYHGYFGMTQRVGDGGGGTATSWAMGIQTWKNTPLICNSSSETAMRSMGFFTVVANPTTGVEQQNKAGDVTSYIWPSTDQCSFWSGFRVGQYLGEGKKVEQVQNGSLRGYVYEGQISFGVKQGNPEPGGDGQPDNRDANITRDDAGMTINAGAKTGTKGNWFWNKKEEIHIIQGEKDNDKQVTELWLSKEGSIRGNGYNAICWTIKADGAHENYKGQAVGRIAIDNNWSAVMHEKWVNVAITNEGKIGGTQVPGTYFQESEGAIGMGEGKGWIKFDDKITFDGTYADENNQINIYARFAG